MEEVDLQLLVEVNWLLSGGSSDMHLFEGLRANLVLIVPE